MGLAPLSREEETNEWQNSVDLIMEADTILIRPDPDNMDWRSGPTNCCSGWRRNIRCGFCWSAISKSAAAVKQRGEYWRISPLPRTPDEMKQMIADSKIAIGGRELYYYSKTTGTRFLTCQAFCQLRALDDVSLRQHLAEIRHSRPASTATAARKWPFSWPTKQSPLARLK